MTSMILVEQARAWLAAIVESSDDAIVSKTLDGIITSWNAGARRIFGYEAEEVIGQSVTMLLPPDRQDEEMAILERLRRGERVDHFESVRQTKDGRRIDVSLTISPIRDGCGRIVGISKIARDITERKRAEEALRTSEARKQAILETSLDGIITMDHEGTIIEVNPAVEPMFGCPPAELLGQKMVGFIPPALRERHRRGLAHYLATGESRVLGQRVELTALRADGSEFPVELAISPIHTESEDRSPMFTGFIRDITERKRFEEQLRAAREQAEEASRAKDHFLAVLSHELRTPLTPVLATVTALEGHPDLPPPLREEVRLVRRNVEVEARLIDDLLDLTRVVRGKINLRREAVDVHSALHNALEFCRAEAEAKGLAVALELRAGRHFAWADPARLRQIFWNLIGNAVKFTPQGGRITLATDDADLGQLAIRVSDTGHGIEPGLLPRIFDAFEQGSRTLTQGHGGLGLGLAISKALAELHGATLEAASAGPGQGATFTMRLEPIATPEAEPALEPDQGQDEATRPLRILVVEDHEDTRRVLARLLHHRGHLVRTAGSVREAQDMFQAGAFDILISDLGLPDGTGLDLMRHLQGQPGLRAIALSGFGMEEDRRRSRDAGFARHLTKPIDFRDLEGAIRQVTA